MIPTLFFLSLCGGFFAGLLGVGGAVVLIPLMLTVPPLVGVGNLNMHEISGITMIQVLAASITGFLTHRRMGLSHTKTILTIGIPMGCFALVGSLLSKHMESKNMLLIFGCLVILAFVMLLKKTFGEEDDSSNEFNFNGTLSIIVGSVIGLVAGIVGAGGGFILIPVMTRILKIPMRVAVGSSLGIIFIGAFMGSLGKILSLQVEWAYLIPVLAGAIPAALIGARLSKKIPAVYIRYSLLVIIFLTILKTWSEIFCMK